jgi:hypothetical protein
MKPKHINISDDGWVALPEQSKWELIEMAANSLRRNCDQTQLLDNGLPFAKRLEWQAYRDELNIDNLKDMYLNADDVVFLTPPEDE